MAALETLRYEHPGIVIEVEPRRSYPRGTLAAHVLGYVGQINAAELKARADLGYRIGDHIGKMGVEKELDADLGAAKNRLAGQSSRLHSLIELEQSLEGYQKGVQAVMAAKKAAASDRIGTIHGLVADIIETEPKYETAIEAELGDRLQNVVVGSQNDSLKAIEYLRLPCS